MENNSNKSNNVDREPLKVVLAPMNIASMPMQIVKALRARGHKANQVHYHNGQRHAFGFELDIAPNLMELGGSVTGQISTIKSLLRDDYDIFHFWNKTLFFDLKYGRMTGFDVPLLKARGKKIAHRFTGFDLRLPSWDIEVNPYSPFRYGYKHPIDEQKQKDFIAFLAEYVDSFLVQDPELAQFAPPNTKILPRALDLSEWEPLPIEDKEIPLIVHAPSKEAVKGTPMVQRAVEELRDEGLKFDFKLIERLSHQEAKEWYQKADIIIDQILIGATGVLTLEAWASQKACIVNLREDLFNPFYNTTNLPVGNANPNTIKDVIRDLVKDKEQRKEIACKGRKLVEEYHDIEKVIPQYEDFYYELLKCPKREPSSFSDFDYLERQVAGMQVKPNLFVRGKTKLKQLSRGKSNNQ